MKEIETKTVGMNTLKRGEYGRISGIFLPEGMKRKMLDMGFAPGSLVECVYHSPFGDPTAYFVKGALIAVRSEEARNIKIEIENEMGI